jgi:hypothetical protein
VRAGAGLLLGACLVGGAAAAGCPWVTWFAKRHRERDRYEAEVTAYRQWVPALSGHAPRLHAADDLRSAIIVSAVPRRAGAVACPDLCALPDTDRLAEQALQREAGVLLRRFHDAQPPLPWDDWGDAKIAEFDGLMAMASGLLGKRDLARARAGSRRSAACLLLAWCPAIATTRRALER